MFSIVVAQNLNCVCCSKLLSWNFLNLTFWLGPSIRTILYCLYIFVTKVSITFSRSTLFSTAFAFFCTSSFLVLKWLRRCGRWAPHLVELADVVGPCAVLGAIHLLHDARHVVQLRREFPLALGPLTHPLLHDLHQVKLRVQQPHDGSVRLRAPQVFAETHRSTSTLPSSGAVWARRSAGSCLWPAVTVDFGRSEVSFPFEWSLFFLLCRSRTSCLNVVGRCKCHFPFSPLCSLKLQCSWYANHMKGKEKHKSNTRAEGWRASGR